MLCIFLGGISPGNSRQNSLETEIQGGKPALRESRKNYGKNENGSVLTKPLGSD